MVTAMARPPPAAPPRAMLKRCTGLVASAARAVIAAQQPVASVATRRWTRSYSTPAEEDAGQEFQPPIKVFGLSGRYASALYSAAKSAKVLPAVEKELTEVLEMAAASPEFKDFMEDPTLPKLEKTKTILEIANDFKLNTVTKHFLGVLAENGRLHMAGKVAEDFKAIMMAERKEMVAVVTTADPMSATDVADVMTALKEALPGISLKIEQKVDPSIIGGLVVTLGESQLDLSVETRIRQLEAVLGEAI